MRQACVPWLISRRAFSINDADVPMYEQALQTCQVDERHFRWAQSVNERYDDKTTLVTPSAFRETRHTIDIASTCMHPILGIADISPAAWSRTMGDGWIPSRPMMRNICMNAEKEVHRVFQTSSCHPEAYYIRTSLRRVANQISGPDDDIIASLSEDRRIRLAFASGLPVFSDGRNPYLHDTERHALNTNDPFRYGGNPYAIRWDSREPLDDEEANWMLIHPSTQYFLKNIQANPNAWNNVHDTERYMHPSRMRVILKLAYNDIEQGKTSSFRDNPTSAYKSMIDAMRDAYDMYSIHTPNNRVHPSPERLHQALLRIHVPDDVISTIIPGWTGAHVGIHKDILSAIHANPLPPSRAISESLKMAELLDPDHAEPCLNEIARRGNGMSTRLLFDYFSLPGRIDHHSTWLKATTHEKTPDWLAGAMAIRAVRSKDEQTMITWPEKWNIPLTAAEMDMLCGLSERHVETMGAQRMIACIGLHRTQTVMDRHVRLRAIHQSEIGKDPAHWMARATPFLTSAITKCQDEKIPGNDSRFMGSLDIMDARAIGTNIDRWLASTEPLSGLGNTMMTCALMGNTQVLVRNNAICFHIRQHGSRYAIPDSLYGSITAVSARDPEIAELTIATMQRNEGSPLPLWPWDAWSPEVRERIRSAYDTHLPIRSMNMGHIISGGEYTWMRDYKNMPLMVAAQDPLMHRIILEKGIPAETIIKHAFSNESDVIAICHAQNMCNGAWTPYGTHVSS
jgi:hypothetical protein